jgi:hypothetical protein
MGFFDGIKKGDREEREREGRGYGSYMGNDRTGE